MSRGFNLRKKHIAQTVYFATLILVLLTSTILVSYTEKTNSANNTMSPDKAESSKDFVEPVIYHLYAMDQDFDSIQDSLESLVLQTLQVNESAVLPVVVTLYSPVSPQDLEYFRRLGGNIRHVYDHVTYGFAGAIPASNLSLFARLEGDRLSMIEYDVPICYHLDVSTPLIRARPTVWDTYGYTGSPNQSIAILDTGIDDSHPDLGPYQDLNFSSKIVGWYDATSDNASTPEDYGEHGTHVAGIAVGTGAANGLQGSGTINTTFTYFLPDAGWGYIDYIDVMNPGVIRLSLQWSGPNVVILRLYNPGGNVVEEVIGGTPPLTIEYSTEGSSYPTGRYRVLVGNYIGASGAPFSCLETYPYEGLNDGYNLFSGVAPNSKLVGVKVFDNTGSGTLAILLDAMDWVIENRQTYRIVVASMSIGLEDGGTDTTLDQKADTLVQNGIVTIVSAGNDYPDFTIGSPGTAAYVITVAATNDKNGITSYSSNGDQAKNEYGLIKPDVAAPGGTFSLAYGNRIISADSNDVDALYSGFPDQNADDYQQMGGTSMSAPHVAGLAALAIQALGGWNWTLEEALKVKMLISMTAFETQEGEGSNVPPLNRGEKDSKEGYGRVNADAVIEAATINYSVGEEANATFGSGPSDKKVWARQVYLTTDYEYTFNLTVPVDADYDLYVYSGTPDSYGQPVILAKSVNASLGAEEIIRFAPNASGTYYILAKWVSGEGSFTLSSTASILRDVAVTDVTVSDTAVYVGETVNITVVVQNYGGVAESFNVTVFHNTTAIETKNVSDLAVGASQVLTFSWNTSGMQPCNNYTIRAEASVVPNESNTANNIYIDGDVKIKMQGDINGDGVVDVFDLSIIGKAYGTFEGQPGYDPDADLNEDGIVDLRDLAVVTINYGNTCL
jgi:subtilisin family serine protease